MSHPASKILAEPVSDPAVGSTVLDPVGCPDCGAPFRPCFKERPHGGSSVTECTHCGAFLSLAHLRVLSRMAERIPAEPVAALAGSRLQVLASPEGVECRIPRKPARHAEKAVLGAVLTALAVGALVAAAGFKSIWATLSLVVLAGAILTGFAREYGSATRLIITSDEVKMERRDWFVQSVKRIPRQDVKSIGLRSWYQENYEPRYGIQISAGTRRLRFGTWLSMVEKAWLTAEIARLTGIPRTDVASPAAEDELPYKPRGRQYQVIRTEESADGTVIVFPPAPSVLFWAPGVTATAIAVLMTVNSLAVGDSAAHYVIPALLLPLGVALLVNAVRARFNRQRLVITAAGCTCRNSLRPSWHAEAGEIRAVRAVPDDLRINRRRVWCGEVLTSRRAFRFGCGSRRELIDHAVLLIRQTISPPHANN